MEQQFNRCVFAGELGDEVHGKEVLLVPPILQLWYIRGIGLSFWSATYLSLDAET